MANKRISDLPAATSSTVGDVLPIDGTTTRKITVENLLTDNLVAIKGLTSAADKGIQFTGVGTASTYDLTAAGKAILDDADATAQRATLGLVIGTNVQAYDADLAALAANAGTGLWSITGSGTGSVRTLTAPAAGITITNGNGVAGNPTLALANDLAALEGLASTGIARRTGADAWSVGTAVANSELAAMAAYTLKGNATGSPATPTDVDIAALTTKASPAAGDYVILSDQAASGAWKKATVSSIGGGGSGVTTLNGQTGALVSYFPPQGRLTLASGVPVMSTSQAAQTMVYYTPYAGNMVPIYDGTNMIPTAFSELSQATTDATKSPAAVAASKVYDLFVWNDGGTIRCTRGPAWTNITTRGYTFTMVNGILLNTSAITNGPAAQRGTWVGTIASNASSTIDYIFGAAGSGGVAASLMVWNVYNRVNTCTTVTDSGASYTYASATVRQARASAGNQITFVLGAQEDGVQFVYQSTSLIVTTAGAATNIGVGFDVTNAFSFGSFAVQQASTATAITGGGNNAGTWNAGIGVHVLAAVENSPAGNNTLDSNSNNALTACIRN